MPARLGLAVLALLLALPAAARAESKTYTFQTGPITVAPYDVKQNNFDYGIPRPLGRRSATRRVVADNRFSARNLLLRRGATVSWAFRGSALHDVTVASEPRNSR